MPAIKEELYELLHELPAESQKMIEKIVEDKKVDAADAEEIKKFIYREKQPGGYEIRLLFDIHDHTYGQENDPSWEALFLDETTRYFSANAGEKIKLPLAKAAMLFDQVKTTIKNVGMMSEVELILIKNLIEITGDLIFMNKSDSNFLLALYEEILKDSTIDFNEIEILREMVCQDIPPILEDLELLFEINLAIMNKPRDDMWRVLFIESVSSYMINKPSEIDIKKAHWLEAKLEGTIEKVQCLTPDEIALLCALKDQTQDFPVGLDFYLTKYSQ
ncbi:MAG: hypothetical protein ACOYM0_00895 [Bacteroidales bacterium]